MNTPTSGKSGKHQKVFEIKCWNTNRGSFLVAASSQKEAAELIGCPVNHLRTHHYVLHSGSPEYALAQSLPRVVFKKNHIQDEYHPLK